MDSMETLVGATTSVSSQKRLDATIFAWVRVVLVTTVWISAGLFGLYILAFYATSWLEGDMEKWNGVLEGLYIPQRVAATSSIALHFAAGGIILVLGSLQLIESIRVRYPAFHRWTGRLYVVASIVAAAGGLTFILISGTIGGPVMNIAFALYGVLMLIAAVETYRHAVARRIEIHRAWALRLYALAIGSWLYRMYYGFWMPVMDGLGHNDVFQGPFDHVMSFFFYLPNLFIAELFIRARRNTMPVWLNLLSTVLLLCVIGFLWLATYHFTKRYWGPPIMEWFS